MKLSFGLLKCRTSLLNSGIENRDLSQRSKSSKRQNHEKEIIMLKTGCLQLQKQELLPPPQMRCWEYVSNRKKGPIFINENEKMLSLEWFNQEISRLAKLLGIQKIKKYYVDGRTLKLVNCMALREAGERHHDNAGGSRKLSAVAADHTMQVKEKHYEKVGEDIEQITQSFQKYHPAWVEGW